MHDLKRILIGNAPPEFLLEVLIRTLLIYLLVLVVVRLLGKRMSGQLTLIEMALLIMLGGIIGSPIQIPDRGILTGFIILLTALILQRTINRLAFRHPRIEYLTQGAANILVKDGMLQLEEMRKERISVQQLFASLRDQEIRHLGEVKRVYLEACGIFSVFRSTSPVPGLAIFPPGDEALAKVYRHEEYALVACQNCGCVSASGINSCPRCHSESLTYAIL